MSAHIDIENLLQEKRDLLSSRPYLITLQREVDEQLAEVGSDPMRRAARAFQILKDHMDHEMGPSLIDLKRAEKALNELLNSVITD